MKPAAFDYQSPTSIAEAVQMLAEPPEDGGDVKVLAGGQSLVPLLSLRLATPARIVDINRIPGLTGISEEGGVLTLGALVRQRTAEHSDVVARACPLMAAAISTNRVVDGNSTHVKDGLTHSFVKHGHCAVKIWPDRGVDKVRVSCWYARARKKPFAKDIQRIWSNNEMTSNSNGWVVSEGAAADSIV